MKLDIIIIINWMHNISISRQQQNRTSNICRAIYILLFYCFLYKLNAYPARCTSTPTDCTLQESQYIKIVPIDESFSGLLMTDEIKLNNASRSVPDFQASQLSSLKPLYMFTSFSNYDLTNYIMNFEFIVAISSVDSGTNYKLYAFFSQTNIASIKGTIVFFSRQIQTKNYFIVGDLKYTQPQPLSFNVSINPSIAIADLFNEYIQLSTSTISYHIVSYNIGMNVMSDISCREGFYSLLAIANNTNLNLQIISFCSQQQQFVSITLSFMIVQKQYLQKSELVFEKSFSYYYATDPNLNSTDLKYNLISNVYFIGISAILSDQNVIRFSIISSINNTNKNNIINDRTSSTYISCWYINAFIAKLKVCPNGQKYYNNTPSSGTPPPLIQACAISCPDGYFSSASVYYGSPVCTLCHFSCQTCSNSTQCIQCPNNRQFNNLTKLCDPMATYFQTNVKNPDPCVSPCIQCSIINNNCTKCNSTSYVNMISPVATGAIALSFTCLSCNSPDLYCQTCTFEQCLTCISSSYKLINNKCTITNLACNDSLWSPQINEECDLPNPNNSLTGCDNCKTMKGFECHLSYQNPKISQCLYNYPLNLTLKSVVKQQFSNDLYIKFALPSTLYFDDETSMNKSLSFSSEDLSDETLKHITHAYSVANQQLTVWLNHDTQNTINKTLTVNLTLHNLGFSFMKSYQSISTSVTFNHNQLNQAYFLLAASDSVLQQATILSNFITVMSIIVFLMILTGFFGGKLIVLEVMAILQMTYLGLLLINRYSPMYLALTRLSFVGGNIIPQLTTVPLLNTLSLNMVFFKNINYQLIFFLIFAIAGSIFLLLHRSSFEFEYKKYFKLIGINCLVQYSLYSLMIWGYLAATSLGLQIYYSIINSVNFQASVDIPNLLIGIVYIIVIVIYLVYYTKHRAYFGEFHRSIKRFYIQQKFITIYFSQKLFTFLLLGLLHQSFRYIGFLLIFIELLMIVFIILKQPFHKFYENIRIILNSSYIIFILFIYNIIKLYQSDMVMINTNAWLSNAIIVVIGFVFAFLLLYNLIELIKQVMVCYERLLNIKQLYLKFQGLDYQQLQDQKSKKFNSSKKQLSSDKDKEEKVFELQNLFEGPKNVTLTPEQQKLWQNILKVKTQADRDKEKLYNNRNTKYTKNQNSQILSPLKNTKQLKRIDNSIKKKLKEKILKLKKEQEDSMLHQDIDQSDELLQGNNIQSIEGHQSYREQNSEWHEQEFSENNEAIFQQKKGQEGSFKNFTDKSNISKNLLGNDDGQQIYKQSKGKKSKTMTSIDHWHQIEKDAQMYSKMQKYQKAQESDRQEDESDEDIDEYNELTSSRNINKSPQKAKKHPILDYHKEQVTKQINEIKNQSIQNLNRMQRK